MNIAIIGYGVVGDGVHELLKDGRLGIHVRRVLDVRPIEGLQGLLTDNIGDILNDPQIDCVVETIGGMHPALSYVTASLRAGRSVVTSNKELIASALAPLAEGAAMHGAQIRFGASVGGGIPWLDNLIRRKRADTISAVYGIVNGTTNYILDAMTHGADFAAALADAQAKGYAEADPSADLDGLDVLRKCAISASLAFDAIIEPSQVPALGIRTIRKEDVAAFAAKGLICKLMMFACQKAQGVSAWVEPVLLTSGTLFAGTPTNHNCIMLVGTHTGRLAFFGEGAGRYPTAANIVSDLMDIAGGIRYRPRAIQPLPVDNEGVLRAYYIRTSKPDAVRDLRAEGWPGGGIVTRPMPVGRMHARAAALREQDAEAFIAGLGEETL